MHVQPCGIPENSGLWRMGTGWAPVLINVSLAVCPGLVTWPLKAWFLPLEDNLGILHLRVDGNMTWRLKPKLGVGNHRKTQVPSHIFPFFLAV